MTANATGIGTGASSLAMRAGRPTTLRLVPTPPRRGRAGIAAAVAAAMLGSASAEDTVRLRTDVDPQLARQLYEESLARQACKVHICTIARKRPADGGDVACEVVKTWPAVDLKEKLLKGKLDWPWGDAQCTAHLTLSRAMLVAAMAEAKYEAKVGKHQVACHLSAASGKDVQTIEFTIDPTVTFENGKAVKASLHWGEVKGSTAAMSALWPTTAADNAFNILQGVLLEQINEFFGGKCDAATATP
jgi:hypothetical protein